MSDDKKDSENESTKKSVIVPIDKTYAEHKESELEKTEPLSEEENSVTEEVVEPVSENDEPVKDTEKQTTEAKSASETDFFAAQQIPHLQTPQSAKKAKLLPIFAILISLLVLIAIAWSVYHLNQMNQDWSQLKNELNLQMREQLEMNQLANQTAQASLQASNQSQQALNQQALLVDQLRQALTINQQRVKDLSGRQKQDWLLAEAEYFIKLAEFKITLEKDKMTAIALLKNADERVLQTGDNTLLELRQMLAQDISDLELVKAPDLSGITTQLNAISKQIPLLSLIALEFAPIEGRSNQDLLKENDKFSWQSIYENFINDFVTIKDHSEPVKPLMTVNQRVNLNSNIQLALQQAQIAVIRGEQGLYQLNLNNAIEWISEFFRHDQVSQSLLENLTQLSQMLVNVQLPAELKAKQSIQTINQQRLYQWLEINKKEPVKNELPEKTGGSL